MIPFCCFRCLQHSFTPDGFCCFCCNYVEQSTNYFIEKFQSAVPESRIASPGYYVSASGASTQANCEVFPFVEPTRDASTQANDDEFPPVEPTRDASTQTTDSDFSFLAQTIGCHEYIDGYKIIYPSQVRAMKVFDQYFDDIHSLQPENSNYCNGYGINIKNCNKATVGSLIDSANYAYVAPKQWTNLHELSQSDNGFNICNSEENVKQRTGYAEQINDYGKLNFAGSISYQSDCSLPNTYLESSKNENTHSDSAEKNNSYLNLPEKRKNSSGDHHYESNAMNIKADLDHSSGKSQRSFFKQNVPEKRSLESGKLSFAGSISYQSECPLPNIYLESSINENTLRGSSEKSSNLILPKKRNNSSSDNHHDGNDTLKKADIDQEAHSSLKSRRNLFKQKAPENRLLECDKLNLSGSINYNSECPLPNTYLESSINENTLVDSAEKSNTNVILPKKRNNSSSDNYIEGNAMTRKAELYQEVLSSGKSRRNLFKQKVPKKRLLDCGKLNLAGSISYQSECTLSNTYIKSSKNENTLGDCAEKSSINLIQPTKRNNSYNDNNHEGNALLVNADLDQIYHLSVKSRGNLFKQKVPEKRLLECGKLSLASSISYQSELPNTYLESSKNENTLGDSSEKYNRYLVLPEKRKNSTSGKHYEGNAMLKKANLDQGNHSSGKSRRNLFKQKVPEKRSLEYEKRTSLETVQKRAIAVSFHLEKETILPSTTSLKKMSPLKNHFLDRELHSSGISHANVLRVEVPMNQPLKCKKCGKLFKSTSKLKVHLKNKCDKEPYRCDHCDKQYSTEYRLIKHRVVHLAEKPFKCDQCGYASKWEKNIQRHKNGYHQK